MGFLGPFIFVYNILSLVTDKKKEYIYNHECYSEKLLLGTIFEKKTLKTCLTFLTDQNLF